MKIVVPCIISIILLSLTTRAQVVVNSLSEDFNTTCADLGPNYAFGWTEYNIIEPKTQLAWNCAPLSGRFNTPGINCSGYYGGKYFLDTAWLFTPLLNLRDINDRIFLRYDSRYQFIAAKMSILLSYSYEPDKPPVRDGVDWIDLTSAQNPVINQNDSIDWVTHWVDITPYKAIPFYIAFRYVSDTTSGGIWTIDNVMTTTSGVNVNNIYKQDIILTVLGVSTPHSIALSASVSTPGNYSIDIYDDLGRRVFQDFLFLKQGLENHTFSNLNLKAGMYMIKITGSNSYALVKTIIP